MAAQTRWVLGSTAIAVIPAELCAPGHWYATSAFGLLTRSSLYKNGWVQFGVCVLESATQIVSPSAAMVSGVPLVTVNGCPPQVAVNAGPAVTTPVAGLRFFSSDPPADVDGSVNHTPWLVVSARA